MIMNIIRESEGLVWNFQDLLESLLSHQITSQLQSSDGGEDGNGDAEEEGNVSFFSIDLQSLRNDFDSFIQTLDNIMEEYIYEVDNMPEDEDVEASSISSSSTTAAAAEKMIGFSKKFEAIKEWLLAAYDYIDFAGLVGMAGLGKTTLARKIYEDVDASCISSSSTTAVAAAEKMIGFSVEFEEIKERLLSTNNNNICLALVGMAGIGKTTFGRKIYEDPEILSYFEFRLWITLGRRSSPRLNQDLQAMLVELKGDEKCLIVLDDAWNTEEFPSFLTSFLEMKNTTIRFLITTREQNVFICVENTLRGYTTYDQVLRFLNEDESKDLLCHKVFGDQNSICPPQLVKAASKIAKKCEGLPLMIVTVADLLSKAQNNDPNYWEDVAEERNSVFTDAYEAISKVLYPSYDYLPVHLKMPFLYLGVFPRYYDIPLSKLINTMVSEGWFFYFIEDIPYEDWFEYCLSSLCDHHNLVLWKPKSIFWSCNKGSSRFKSCRLHSSWQYLCRVEARKNKFYHVLNRLVDASEETMKGQRCLCLENNLLFGLTEFCNSVKLHSASSYTRSLLFFGPYHQYPTPIDAIGFKLLKELDALQLRFYTFPTQVLALVQLKYLALTCNGQLPRTISKLFNLKVLIIHPHTSIIKCYDPTPSYIPIQIWDMKELEHIEILGKSLLTPPNHFASLEKLSTLVGVNAASICNISNRTPHIIKLGVQIELTPYDDVEHSSDLILSFFPHISILQSLETLKCSIINPVVVNKYGFLTPTCSTTSSLMLPFGLKKLHLSGMGFSWDYMDVIGSLPNLQVLKLRSYAFRGPKWEIRAGSFRRLGFLLIEDSDLVQWKPSSGSFTNLSYLSMKHCYKLQELYWPSEFGKIELVDCNPIGVSCAKSLEGKGDYDITVTASDHYDEA